MDAHSTHYATDEHPLLLAAVCAALFVEAMNVSVVSIALPVIQSELDVSPAVLQWVHGAFILGFAGLLLLGGRTADLYGRRRVFLAGTAGFGAAALAAAIVPSIEGLLVARFVQGASAAFFVPAAISMLTTTYPEGPARNRALGAFNAAGAAGFSAGLVIGGLLTDAFGWRSIFLVNVPAAALVFVAVLFAAPADGKSNSDELDVPGAVSGTLAVGLLISAVTAAAEGGPGWLPMLALAGSLMAAVLFVVHELRTRRPLLPPRLLTEGTVLPANLASLTLLGSFFGFNFVLSLAMQSRFGFTPAEAGLRLLPMSLLTLVVSRWATPALVQRFGPGPVASVGLLLTAAGAAYLALTLAMESFVLSALPASLFSGGLGMGLTYAALALAGVAGVAPSEQGVAAGLQQTSLQVGGAVGVALAAAAMSLAPGDLAAAAQSGLWTAAAIGLSGAVAAFGIRSGLPARTPRAPMHCCTVGTAEVCISSPSPPGLPAPQPKET